MPQSLAISGMHCQMCVGKLKAAFERIPGVRSAHVRLSPPTAHIESDAPIPFDALADAARAAGNYTIEDASIDLDAPPAAATMPAAAERAPSLYPLFLIVAFIAGTTLLAASPSTAAQWRAWMTDFMAGFFLVFSFFKLLDLRGFADAYQSYDIIARRSRPYALAYPFIELALGVAYLLDWQPTITNSITLALMLIGSIGVIRAVLDKRRIRCACLGTALNLPMTTVTIVEDLGMAAMAGAALIWPH